MAVLTATQKCKSHLNTCTHTALTSYTTQCKSHSTPHTHTHTHTHTPHTHAHTHMHNNKRQYEYSMSHSRSKMVINATHMGHRS